MADPDGLAKWLVGVRGFFPRLRGKCRRRRRRGGLHSSIKRARSPPPQSVRCAACQLPRERGAKEDIILTAPAGAAPIVDVLDTDTRIPWAGHMARHVMPDIYQAIKKANLTLVFVNTRAQAEATFQDLWRLNDDVLPIALHHGSLDVAQRRKVEAAMARGDLKAVVCTSTLDLGIDWGDVDLVVQVGAPKGAARLVQRIGRSNHRFDEPSRALLAPSNRFEVLECRAAQEAVTEGALDGCRSAQRRARLLGAAHHGLLLRRADGCGRIV